jgi:DegV family protein with EDD domain
LNRQQVDQYGIEIVPITFYAGGKFYRDWVDISPSEAYKLFLNDPDTFKTSAPTPEEYLQIYRQAAKKAPNILCITISKKLSRVYDSAIAAIETAEAEIPGTKIEVIDSMQATSSEGMIALAAARAADDGKDLPEVMQAAETVRGKVHAMAFLDTLEHVYRSGRIPKIASQLGSALNIKPILTIHETVHFATMARTRKKGMDKMLEMMREKAGDKPIRAAVTHAYALEEAEILKERIGKEFNCLEVWLSEFSPVMGYACGTGTVGLSFYTEGLY